MGGGVSIQGSGPGGVLPVFIKETDLKPLLGNNPEAQRLIASITSEGMIKKWDLLKVWMPHPGVGFTKSCWEANYTRQPDADYDQCLSVHYDEWLSSFFGMEGNTKWHTPDGKKHCLMMCKSQFGSWPRGMGVGQLMEEPVYDDVPCEHRGIAKEWLAAVWNNWTGKHMYWLPQTRLFVACFIKPVTKAFGCSLYDLVPPQYRKKPECFLSHSWDLALHCILKAAPQDWNGATSYWLDLFAINQHAYGDDIGKIGQIVESISNTTIILRGEGPASENLRVMYRSWCIYEICFTPDGYLQCAITAQNGDHKEYAAAIKSLDISNASALFENDKTHIDGLVLKKYGSFENANKIVQKSVRKGYLDFFAQGHGFGEPFSEKAVAAGTAYARNIYGPN